MLFDYASTEPVSTAVAQAVLADAQVPFRDHEEAFQPLDVKLDAQSRRLSGSRAVAGPLMFAPPFREAFMAEASRMSAGEASYLGCISARFTVTMLEQWSTKYGISWTVATPNGLLGTVSAGEVSAGVRQFVSGFCMSPFVLPSDAKAK